MKLSDLSTSKDIANLFDHTYLKADASDKEMKKLCDEAKLIGAKMVAINPCWVKFCKEELKGTDVHVGAAIGFPLGQSTLETKVFETKDAITKGADEIDYVVNISNIKNNKWDLVEQEMKEIVEICKEASVTSKVIFEICYLNNEEIKKLAEISLKVKPDFIKTSTGFGTSGATIEAVKLMKETVGEEVEVKAAGGIRDYQTFKKMVENGATRIGTSSSLKILEEFENENMHK